MDKKSFIKKAGTGLLGLTSLLNVGCNKAEVKPITINYTDGAVEYVLKNSTGIYLKVLDSDGNGILDTNFNDKVEEYVDGKVAVRYGAGAVVDQKGQTHTPNTPGTEGIFKLRNEKFEKYTPMMKKWTNQVYNQIERNLRNIRPNCSIHINYKK